MRVYSGVSALSDSRQTVLLARLQKIDKNIQGISAEFMHFVAGPLPTAAEEKQLKALLSYGTPFTGKSTSQLFLVVPRPGTISPWSSKATDIAHNAGLSSIKRVERGLAYYITATKKLKTRPAIAAVLHDRMTEAVLEHINQAEVLFKETDPQPVRTIDILGPDGKDVLTRANRDYILALAPDEIDYLYQAYQELGRNPTDAELMMFGAVNSEHCRHKVFNAAWRINNKAQPKSLFQMIKNTHQKSGDNVLSAYSDNAAVLRGGKAGYFAPDPKTGVYQTQDEPLHIVIKAETHNHPTAIAPFPGAATGTGGEIRDEAATGRGARTKMGLAGYSVSNLMLPGALRPWEQGYGKPDRIASAKDIMLEAPLGAAAFGNEFGRPNLAGYFRTYEQALETGEVRGYHKPIMLAGGLGAIREQFIQKKPIPVGSKLIVLGGPAMLIGLGGGSGSSVEAGASKADLDFASVQRSNGEMQRRAQEVINACTALGKSNPIISIHDVGAGGLSNALPELVHDAGLGATFELRDIPSAEPGMSPMEIWCNEAQERYVLAIAQKDEPLFQKLCARERCPYAVVGTATKEDHLTLRDKHFDNNPVDIPMSLLFGKPPKMERTVTRQPITQPAFDTADIKLDEAVQRVLQLPAVGSKKFLITIGDRTVSGLVARDQMVGPWQVPVSDVAVTARSFNSNEGEAMAMGERTPLALINGPAAARIAIGEVVTNMAAAAIANVSDIKLSANWMAAVGHGTEDQTLFDTVHAVGEKFCPALGMTIPVGKDSLSMRTVWQDGKTEKSVTSPLSLLVSGFAPVTDVTKTLTPQLQKEDSVLIAIDLSEGRQRLGGSALAQVYNSLGNESPDVSPAVLKQFFDSIQKLKSQHLLLAYHDRSDGGLFATLCEMAFAARTGLDIALDNLPGETLQQLFSEELGAVIQVSRRHQDAVLKKLGPHAYVIGRPAATQEIVITKNGQQVYRNVRSQLEQWWADTSYRMQALRDNAACAQAEFDAITDDADPGLLPFVPFESKQKTYRSRPKVAILREQGVNGQVEMAAAFDHAGFTAVDVPLQDLIQGTAKLKDFVGLAACGGFSYGDVLGAGEGWAKSILFNKKMRHEFQTFFHSTDTFSFGVCNGCQMMSALKELIPGADHWPRFLRNQSEQFEARLVMVKINDTPSIMFRGMAGACLPVPTAHGEGLAHFDGATALQNARTLSPMQYTDNRCNVTGLYPFNPNGSPDGITALTSQDGRATIMMPHPERVFLTKQFSWHPKEWGQVSPWFQLFQNARDWVG